MEEPPFCSFSKAKTESSVLHTCLSVQGGSRWVRTDVSDLGDILLCCFVVCIIRLCFIPSPVVKAAASLLCARSTSACTGLVWVLTFLLGSSTSSERHRMGLKGVHGVLVSVPTAKKSPENLKPAVLYQGVVEQRSHRNKPALYQM